MGPALPMLAWPLLVAWLAAGLAGCSPAETEADPEDPAACALDPAEGEPEAP